MTSYRQRRRPQYFPRSNHIPIQINTFAKFVFSNRMIFLVEIFGDTEIEEIAI